MSHAHPSHWQVDVPLAPLSTFGLGGRAAFYVRVETPEELVVAVREARARGQHYEVVAGCSNVVFPDDTLDTLLIHFKAQPELKPVAAGGMLEASAGLTLASLIESSIEHSLTGLEALSGIPGTVGGAVVGNAGAYGQSISDRLVGVEIFDVERDETRWLTKNECHFAYRESIFKQNRDWLVLRAKWELEPGDKAVLVQKSAEIIKVRNEKYVPGIKCPGSFFKNVLVADVSPEALAKIAPDKIRDGKIATGWLLEQAGARGMSEGEIEVASFHGNLLFNKGNGTAEQVKILAERLKQLVWEKFGIKLEEEVRYLT